MASRSRFIFHILAALALSAGLQSARASCVLKITKVAPCLSNGTPGLPEIGTPYGVRVTFNVSGTPAKPFAIEFTIANVTHTFSGYSLKPGNGYFTYCLVDIPLDDSIPYSVTLDPAKVTGNTNPNTTVSGTFSPKPPKTAIQTYSPVTKYGSVARTIVFAPGATLTNLYALLGVPTTHGAQQVLTTTAPLNSQTVTTAPYSLPVYQVLQSNIPAGTYSFSNSFTVTLSKMRVNPTLLRKITWAALGSMTPDYTQWLAPDAINESTDSAITNFVAQTLPSGYQATMTPYDAARTLHRAVMRALTYVEPPPYDDAVSSLNVGQGDCGCYAAILVASLRSIGIPARRISGFWQGFSQSHVRVEFYLPGAGWIDADPTLGNGLDPTGTYAYFFGSVNDSDQFVAVDDCDSHQMTDFDIDAQDLQTPSIWYWSNSSLTIESNTFFSYLQPGPTGGYTVLLHPAVSGAGIPQGTGYGLLTMSSTGGIILAGQLPDGESFSTTGAIGGSGGDQFSFDTPLAYSGGQGALSGTLNFVTTTGPFETTGSGDFSGTVAWSKPEQTGGNYPASFQTTLNAAGSLYTPPAAGGSVLPNFTKGTLTLTGSSALAATGSVTLVKNVTLTAKNTIKVTNPGKDKLKLTITPSTGVFKGTFLDSPPGAKPLVTTFTGVLFQQETNGGGFFLGSQGAGSVTLTP
ncbi:MAG TPA: transglutaminase-like domain-containing protein [Chthoniobacteraceae bacterium]|jgi:transglutaminase-like putative cysteine protease|nr:transglutaminase-like domain-containing protein [Chthoniobacteraceae bacterium]